MTESELLAVLSGNALEVAPLLLGSELTVTDAEGAVTVRLTEVEAYLGSTDPGSHGYRGQTARNSTMFGPAGHLYVYFTYGMHFCANVVCGSAGESMGVLLRAGEVVSGIELARSRRATARKDAELARGPARLATALGIGRGDDGLPVTGPRVQLRLAEAVGEEQAGEPLGESVVGIARGPRTGVSGPGGSSEYPWRFWIPGEPSVSPYRAHVPRVRPAL